MNKKILAIVLGVILVATAVVGFAGCAHQHDFEVYYQYEDCDTAGYTLHTCTKCGYQYADEFTEPLGHSVRTYYHVEEISSGADQFATCSLTRDGGSSSHYSLFTSVDADALSELFGKKDDIVICKHTRCEFCNDPIFAFYESGIIDVDQMMGEMGRVDKNTNNYEHVTVNIPSVETWNGIEIPKTRIKTGEFDYLRDEIKGRWSLVIPDSVKHIEAAAFRNCTKLNRLKLPNNVTDIDEYAFHGAKIPYVIIPASVKYIGKEAFGLCVGTMYAVYYCGTEEQWSQIEFDDPNEPLKRIKVYYYNEQSTTEGKYWRYNGDGEPYHDIKITYINRHM